MIYFLAFIAMLVPVPQFCKKQWPKVHQKNGVAFSGGQFAQSFATINCWKPSSSHKTDLHSWSTFSLLLQLWFQYLSFVKKHIDQRSIKKYGVAFGGQFAQSFNTYYKLFETSILLQNQFTLMIYFLTFIAMLVSCSQFCKKKQWPKVHQKIWGCLWWPICTILLDLLKVR